MIRSRALQIIRSMISSALRLRRRTRSYRFVVKKSARAMANSREQQLQPRTELGLKKRTNQKTNTSSSTSWFLRHGGVTCRRWLARGATLKLPVLAYRSGPVSVNHQGPTGCGRSEPAFMCLSIILANSVVGGRGLVLFVKFFFFCWSSSLGSSLTSWTRRWLWTRFEELFLWRARG